MVEAAIGIGLIVSLIFAESLGLAAGGMVVPGYIALYIHKPFTVAGTIIASLMTQGTLRVITNYILIYGRRRMVFAVLFGFIFGWIAKNLFVLSFPQYTVELASIGYIIPGLIANSMERQGTIRTLLVMVIAAIIVRICLMLIMGR